MKNLGIVAWASEFHALQYSNIKIGGQEKKCLTKVCVSQKLTLSSQSRLLVIINITINIFIFTKDISSIDFR